MKNRQIFYLIVFFMSFQVPLLIAQEDCDKCPGCQVKLTTGQQELAKQLSKAKEETEFYRKKAANGVDKNELDRAKADYNRSLSDNSSLNAQLTTSQNANTALNAEITKLKEQLRLKTEEATNNKNEVEKQKSEIERLKAESQRLGALISGTTTGATCINDWLNDRISKTHGKILLKGGVFNLHERNEAASEICLISFEGNSTTIKQIKVGAEIMTDPVMIECMLNRIENLFIHYQDLYYLRFSVRNKTAGKAQLAFIQEKYYKNTFEQDRKSEQKEKASGVELKRLTTVKWGKESDENTISISIALDKDN